MPRPKVLFLLADGARARFVERSPETGYFVTVQEIDGRQSLQALRSELRASQPARTMDQNLPGGHAMSQQDFLRSAKEAFAAEVAERAAALVRKRAYQGVFLAAPDRLVGVLRRGLAGKAHITGEINRDLTKAPDAELGRWLPLGATATPAS
jgi:protein required for attachment to host cells